MASPTGFESVLSPAVKKGEWRKKFPTYATWVGLNPSTVSVSWYEFLDAWGDLLLSGRAELGGLLYVVWAGKVQEAF
jgi:hypothetical protein